MTDPVATQPSGDASAATDSQQPAAQPAAAPTPTPPANPAPDVEAIVSERLNAALAEWEEKRIKPLQREISERDTMIRQLREAGMTPEEREQQRIEEAERARRELETENWLLRKSRENAAAADILERFLRLEDPDEMFAFAAELAARQAPPAPTPPAQPEPSEQVPDIDRNNPRSGQVPSGTPVTSDGQVLDKAFRENFLKNLQSWPGA